MSQSQESDFEQCCKERDVHIEHNKYVCWDEDGEQHPRNWPPLAKYYTTAVVVWLEFFMTAISSSGTAAAKPASDEHHMSKTLAYFAFVSVYLIGQTMGSIFCSPISEVFGRRTIYIIATFVFGASCAVTAAVPHVAGIYVGRFLQGVAAAIPATVAFGNFSDMFAAGARIWIVYAYTIWGMAGLALGPIFSTYVTLRLGWRWIFWISTIASAVSLFISAFIRESNASQLLEARAEQIRKITNRRSFFASDMEDKSDSPIKDFFRDRIYRPVVFLFTEPLVTLCAILCAIAFGLIYGLTESLMIVYTTPPFDLTFTETTSCLSFLMILLGEILNIFPRFYDDYLFDKHRREHRRIEPETKIRSFAIACPALAIGLWIFAWTVPSIVTGVPWIVSMIGLVFIGFAANDFSYVLFGYITDSYGPYAASAVSSLSIARTLTAAAFPLFVTQMYEGLGNNFATTILAACATLFCITPVLFLKYGSKLRQKSKWAVKGADALSEENEHMNKYDEQDGMSRKAESSSDDHLWGIQYARGSLFRVVEIGELAETRLHSHQYHNSIETEGSL